MNIEVRPSLHWRDATHARCTTRTSHTAHHTHTPSTCRPRTARASHAHHTRITRAPFAHHASRPRPARVPPPWQVGSVESAKRVLRDGKVFQGGNWNHLHRLLDLRTGSDLMYVGDHMYSDILRSKRTLGWRTVLIVPELLREVETAQLSANVQKQISRLHGEVDTGQLHGVVARTEINISALFHTY